MEQKLYRALYTWCVNGRDFYDMPSSQGGQKLFSTSGNMGVSKETLTLIESVIKRDIYKAGERPFKGEACQYLVCSEISAFVHYRWLKKAETGGSGVGITKVLIGNFEDYPIEYFSFDFFNKDFYFDYPDADGQPITSYNQLLTFKKETPPLFKQISKETLLSLKNSYSPSTIMTFKRVGSFVLQENAKNIAKRLSAMVNHLVKQFSLPFEQRQSIVIDGTPEQIKYWFAAIGYAFSALSMQSVSFSIGLPPIGFAYNFSTSALVGWDVSDPDIAKASNAMPANLVYYKNIPIAESEPCYAAIANFDKNHLSFSSKFTKNCNDVIKNFKKRYNDFVDYERYCAFLNDFVNEKEEDFSLKDCIKKINNYLLECYFMPEFYIAVLSASEKRIPKNCAEIGDLIEIYNLLEKTVERSELDSTETKQIKEKLKNSYIKCFYDIFSKILSNSLSFFNYSPQKKPQEYFNEIVNGNQDCAYKIAERLTEDSAFDKYQFLLQPISNDFSLDAYQSDKTYLTDIVYPRLALVAYMMKWCQRTMTTSSARYVCRAFNAALLQYPCNSTQYNKVMDSKLLKTPILSIAARTAVYKNLFLPFRNKKSPINASGTLGLKAYWDCAYHPQSIDAQVYDDLLEKTFLYNWKTQIEQCKTDPIEYRISAANGLIKKYIDAGFSESTLVSLYIECYDLEDSQSVFYYRNVIKLFNSNMHSVLLQEIISNILERTLNAKFYTHDDELCLSKIVALLSALEKVDLRNWSTYCKIVDNHLVKTFNISNWEDCISSSLNHIYEVANYLFEASRPPNSVQFKLYNSICNYNEQNGDPDTMLNNYQQHRSVFQKAPLTFRDAVLRATKGKTWTGEFYIQLLALFAFDDSFIPELLIAISNSKSCNGKLIFNDFCLCITKEYQEHKNEFGLSKVTKIYKMLLHNILKMVFLSSKYTKDDDCFLSEVIPLLSTIKEIDNKCSLEYSEIIDSKMSEVFELQNWEECITDSENQLYRLATFFIANGLPFSIQICLYSLISNCNVKKDNLDTLVTAYIPCNKTFRKCCRTYKSSLLKVIENKKWSGDFFLQLLKLFVYDGGFLNKIMKVIGTAKTSNGEYVFLEFCKAYMNEYRNSANLTKNEQKIKSVILDVTKNYYRALRPTILKFAAVEFSVIKEFEKAAKKDKDLAEMQTKLTSPIVKVVKAMGKKSKEEQFNQNDYEDFNIGNSQPLRRQDEAMPNANVDNYGNIRRKCHYCGREDVFYQECCQFCHHKL